MSTQPVTPQANKENLDQKAHAILTPPSVETASSSTDSLSKQRVVFSGKNLEQIHFFEPVLTANRTPSSTQEPSKSILKKRSYDEFLADDALFASLVPPRSSTPEPDTEEALAGYLLSPVTTLVQSVEGGRAGDVNNQDMIEAYCVLTARIRAKFLPAAAPSGRTEEAIELAKGLHPAMYPVQEYVDHLVSAMARDIARAREDPLQDFPHSPVVDKPLAEGYANATATATLPSPPPSSPSPFDPQATPKRAGMNEQQVKHARDLCTVSQSAMKLLVVLFCFTDVIQAGELFTRRFPSSLTPPCPDAFRSNSLVHSASDIARHPSIVTTSNTQLSENLRAGDHTFDGIFNSIYTLRDAVLFSYFRYHYSKHASNYMFTSSWH